MTRKLLFFATLAATALIANAGEDSTHRWGAGGTGPSFWDTPCGLKGFSALQDQPPCTSSDKAAQDMSPEQMRAWMEQHMKVMDEMTNRMRDEHRAMTSSTGSSRETGGTDGAGR